MGHLVALAPLHTCWHPLGGRLSVRLEIDA